MRNVMCACLALACCIGVASAQDLGGLPSTHAWQQLRSDSIRMVTTKSGEAFSRRAFALDQALIRLRPLPLGERVEPISVVVQPVTTVPNGFVGLAPFRSYLYATPPQAADFVSANAWADALAIHEYRHVEQFTNLRRGWTRFASIVAGDGGWGVLTGLSTPDWFFEGDAVYAETAFTYAGRGRLPNFTVLQRALAFDDIRYGYEVARNGSLNQRVPNHYPLGYALVAHGRHAYQDVWPEVMRGAGNFWPPFYPFSTALGRQTGLSTRRFYESAYDSLATVWTAQRRDLKPHQVESLTASIRDTQSIAIYSTPLPLANGDVLAVRSSRSSISELVRMDSSGKATRLALLGANFDESLTVGGNVVAWTQYRNNWRRSNEDYSVIVTYDLKTDQQKVLTQRSKLFSPAVSPDGSRIVAVEQRVGLSPKLITLDATTGEQLADIEVDFDLVSFPRWVGDETARRVVCVGKRNGVLAIWLLDLSNVEAPRQLTPWSRHSLGIPFVDGDYVYFSASYSGIDNVYRIAHNSASAKTTRIEQLTDHPIGAYAPSVAGEKLYYTTVTPYGDPVEVLTADDWLRQAIAQLVEPAELPQYENIQPDAAGAEFRQRFMLKDPIAEANDQLSAISSDVGVVEQPLRPYGGLLRGYSIHTWQPLATQQEVSIEVTGSNVLNDFQTSVTGGYNLNENKGFGSAEVTLARTWPWLVARGEISGRSAFSLDFPRPDTVVARVADFQESSFGLAVQAPVSQTLGAYSLSVTPELGADYRRFTVDDEDAELPGTDGLASIGGNLSFRLLRQQAAKHITPRGGLIADVALQQAVDGSNANQLTASAGVLAPGLTPEHSVVVRGNLRVEDATEAYQFPDRYGYARGYDKTVNSAALGASIDYHLPLWYPDLGVAGIVYARRIRAALWADVMRLRLPEQFVERDEVVRSVGVDFYLDAIFFNVQPLPVGVRFAYRLDDARFGGGNRGWDDVRLLLRLPI